MAEHERPPRVLVVEDDDAIAQVLQRSLRMEGYEVKVAGDGVSALDLAHAYLPDLVILDLGLPRLDGVDVARALLRRRPPRGQAALAVGDLKLNPDTHEVSRGDRQIELTQREFELLEYLMRNERIVVSRQRLLDEVWGYDPFSMTNTIEVFVSNLRRKLEAGGEPRLLHTIRGAGYVLRV
jgi:DNA-binding response OmpR family regulator